VQPYYNQYLAPHVEKVQPHIDRVKSQVYDPAYTFARTNYAKHGAHRVAQAQKIGQHQWEKRILPQLETVQASAWKQFDAILGPHVQKVDDLVRPYYESIQTSVNDLWELEVQPAYHYASPYARRAYKQAHRFTTNTALPYAQYGGNVAWTLVHRHIWPTVQVLYGENVEPQIMRIKQRLGRYKDEKLVEAAVESIESASTTSSISSLSSSIHSSMAASVSTSSASIISTASQPTEVRETVAEPEVSQSPAEQFNEDLELWQHQVNRAVQEGSDHLGERIEEICDSQIKRQVHGVGEALIIQLEEAGSSAFKGIKTRIQNAVEDLNDESTSNDVSKTQEKLANRIRLAGQTIRTKAQSIRDWKSTFDSETNNLVEAAANSTLETIDNIRDLRLQEIGRKWAHNDAITHKDWSRYNELKKTSSKWRDTVATVALKHPKLTDARRAAAEVEEKAMIVAEQAAKELARLKSVAQRKVDARDASDDFNSQAIPAAAERASQLVMDAVSGASEVIGGSTQGTIESVTSAASSRAKDAASGVSEAVVGSETGTVESMASQISEKVLGSSTGMAESAASRISESVVGTSTGSAESIAKRISESVIGSSTGSAESLATSLSSKVIGTEPNVVEKAYSIASENAIGTEQPTLESVTSVVQASAESAASVVYENIQPSSQPVHESVISVVSDNAEQIASSASASVVGTSQPVIESVTSVARQSAESIASAASENVIGTEPGMAEKAATKASEAVYGQETPGMKSISSISSAVSSRISSAQKSQTLGPKAASMLSVGKDQASEASSSVVEAATPAVQSASSVASSASRRVMGGAMAQAVPDRQVILDEDVDDEDTYSAQARSVVNGALEQAASLSKAVEDAIRATPTQNSYDSITSVASDQYSSAMAAASSVLYGTTPGVNEQVASYASDRYSEAVQA